jgi:hypothetical protein
MFNLSTPYIYGGTPPTPFDPSTYGIDALDNVYGVHGVARILTSWTGNLVRLRRSSDNVERDFSYVSATGFLDTGSITDWLLGGTGFVTTIYDQTGNSRHWTRSTQSQQPQIDLAGAHPVINFDGGDHLTGAGTTLLGWTNAQAAVSAICVWKPLGTGSFQNMFASSYGAGTTVRVGLQLDNGGNIRISSNANDSTTVNSTGVTHGNAWGTQIARWDVANTDWFHRFESLTESALTWSGASGTFPASDSQAIALGANPAFGGITTSGTKFAALILTRDKLSDAEDSSLVTSLAGLKL